MSLPLSTTSRPANPRGPTMLTIVAKKEKGPWLVGTTATPPTGEHTFSIRQQYGGHVYVLPGEYFAVVGKAA